MIMSCKETLNNFKKKMNSYMLGPLFTSKWNMLLGIPLSKEICQIEDTMLYKYEVKINIRKRTKGRDYETMSLFPIFVIFYGSKWYNVCCLTIFFVISIFHSLYTDLDYSSLHVVCMTRPWQEWGSISRPLVAERSWVLAPLMPRHHQASRDCSFT